MTEDAIEARLDALQRSVDDGFTRVNQRLETVEADVKAVHQEGLPRRLHRLEQWRDALNGRVWKLLIGLAVAVVAAWAPFLLQQSGVF